MDEVIVCSVCGEILNKKTKDAPPFLDLEMEIICKKCNVNFTGADGWMKIENVWLKPVTPIEVPAELINPDNNLELENIEEPINSSL